MALPTSPPSKWRNKNHRNFYFQRSSFGVGVFLGSQWLRDARLSLFPRWEYFIPSMGTSCSQCGNFLCNRDCCLIRHGYWMTEAGYWTIRAGYWKLSDGYWKIPISPVNPLWSPCLWVFWILIYPSSLPLSLPLSLPSSLTWSHTLII